MVGTFMEGIDPSFGKTITSYMEEILNKIPEEILGNIKLASGQNKTNIEKTLKKACKNMGSFFKSKMRDYSHSEHISPIMNAVSVLPKDELAKMAESLVSITSFKRKITLEAESVGGPIDVAVISKGDGFIWVQRKHYFKPELNHSFLSNYFNQYTNGGKNYE